MVKPSAAVWRFDEVASKREMKFGDWSNDSGLCLTGKRRMKKSNVREGGKEKRGLEGKRGLKRPSRRIKVGDFFE